jgi:hypothetical protein
MDAPASAHGEALAVMVAGGAQDPDDGVHEHFGHGSGRLVKPAHPT